MKVALTGTMGAGKSTVSHMLRDMGFAVWSTDAWVHEFYEPDGVLYQAVIDLFGSTILDGETISRKKLATLVFADMDKLQQLEAVVFPRVYQKIADYKAQEALVFFEVPLLFESEGESYFDEIVMVDAPLPLRKKRLQERGLSELEIAQRLKRHVPDAVKRAKSPMILENDGSLKELQQKVEKMSKDLERKQHG